MKKTVHFIFILLASMAGWQCDKAVADNSAAYAPANGQGGSLARFAISGNYLYTVDKEKLKVYNISDPATPVLKNTTDVGFEIETIFPFKDKLFIGSTSVVHIFAIDDPEHPQRLSTASSPQVFRRCDPVVAKDTVAYATLRTNGPCGGVQSILAVYDIKNILAPKQVSTVNVSEPYGLGYADSVLYVCDHQQGLVLYSIKNPYQPRYLKQLRDGDYMDVIPYNNTLICWIREGAILYDISLPASPKLIAKII